jgi:hypothetical protein
MHKKQDRAHGNGAHERKFPAPRQHNNGHAAPRVRSIHFCNGKRAAIPRKGKAGQQPGSPASTNGAYSAREQSQVTQSRNGKHRKSNRVLLDERPLVLLPSLAKAVGVDGAIVIQQLHFHLANPVNGREHDGARWIYKTYEDWKENDFPFWNVFKIQRVFLALEKKRVISSCQPEGRKSRRKYYRIDYERLEQIVAAASAEHSKSACSMIANLHVPLIRDDPAERKISNEIKLPASATTASCSVSPLAILSEEGSEAVNAFTSLLSERFPRRWLPVTKCTDKLDEALDRAVEIREDVEVFTRLCQDVARVCGDPRFKGRGGEYSYTDQCGEEHEFVVPKAQRKHRGRNSIMDLIWKNY